MLLVSEKIDIYLSWYTYVEKRQPPVSKRRDEVRQDCDGEEDQVGLVVHGVEDTSLHSIGAGGPENVNAANDEEGGTKVHGEGDGDVSKEVSPAADPGEHAAVLGRRDHECLVVDTTSSWVDGSDLTKRGRNGDHDGTNGHPTPDDVGGTTAVERVDKSSSQTVWNRGEHTGHEGDLPCRTRASELGLVTQLSKMILG